MTEKPEHDPEAIASRLAGEAQNAKKTDRTGRKSSTSSRLVPALVIVGLGAAFVAFIYWPKTKQAADLTTGTPEQFQTDAARPFGQLALPAQKTQLPDPNLLKEIADLKAAIEALKNQPPPVEDDNTEELEALQNKISELDESLNQAQQKYDQSQAEHDRLINEMQLELDIANLQGDDNSDAVSAEAFYQQRIKSPLMAYDTEPSAASQNYSDDGADSRRLSGNELFAREHAKPVLVEKSKLIANPANTVMQGTMIQAALETAINTDLPGAIRAITTENIHSFDGTRVLIPRGSHVIGAYSDDILLGQRRAMVIWHRIIMPDNQTVNIGAYGGDVIGRSGVGGKVDTHFAERFGSATLVSLITLAPALLVKDKQNNSDDNSSDIADAMTQSLSGAMSNTLSAYLNRKPTIEINQGAEVTIMVDRDLEIF